MTKIKDVVEVLGIILGIGKHKESKYKPEPIKRIPRKLLAEAEELMKRHRLPETVDTLYTGKKAIEIFRGCKVILHVSSKNFCELVEKLKPKYAFEWSHPGDNSGGYGPRIVWFVTQGGLRIQADWISPGENSFMDDILYPSDMAQFSKLVSIIGNREISSEEMEKLERKLGFVVNDHMIYDLPYSSERVSRIKLLSRKVAKKYKGKMFGISLSSGKKDSEK